nr:PREDICTED: UPF0193 protein EVG1 isoform X2 [Anolis carolinensis]|eukprot:XP_008118507.1 PREDICTED: UPF0193 protein EVG1 isoform X2 [Anolis carolinensis]
MVTGAAGSGITMTFRERNIPAVAKGTGFWHVPTGIKYSHETQELLKVMMQESKLTSFQQRHLTNCMKRDLEKEKERLQNILATGKDKKMKKPQKQPVKVEEEVPELDRFDELVNEIQDRQKFLAEMEGLGQGKLYHGMILTEISQKLHEMELIDKQRSTELKDAMAKSFNIGNKPDPQSTEGDQ